MTPLVELAFGILLGAYCCAALVTLAARALTISLALGWNPRLREVFEDHEAGGWAERFSWIEIAWHYQQSRVLVAFALEALLWPLVALDMIPGFDALLGETVGGVEDSGLTVEQLIERSRGSRFGITSTVVPDPDRRHGYVLRVICRGAMHHFTRDELDDPGPPALRCTPSALLRLRAQFDAHAACEAAGLEGEDA